MATMHPDLVTCWVLQCTVSERLWDYLNVHPFFVELGLISGIFNAIHSLDVI